MNDNINGGESDGRKIVQIFQELGKKAISPYELYDLMNDIEVNWQKFL